MASSPMWMSNFGSSGPLRPVRFSLRQAVQGQPVGLDPLEVQRIAKPPAGGPVDFDLRRRHEHAALVEHRDILQPGLAEDRSLDPPDAESQAGSGLELSDTVDDEPVPGRRVEHDETDDCGGQEDHEKCDQLGEQSPRPVPLQAIAALLGGRSANRVFHAQNA